MRTREFARRTARVLLVDAAGRILLFHLHRDHRRPERGGYWLTPGGGVDKGETLVDAAVRELREETGLVVAPADLGPHVAFSSGYADMGWARGLFRDDYFFHRVDGHEVDISGFEALEAAQHIGHRWWPAADLHTTGDDVVPRGLAPLLSDLLDGRIPELPVVLPWHH